MNDPENTFSLKWENHHSNILTSVAALSNNVSYSDVTLCCEGSLFPVHRFILSSCSDYFASLFEQLPDKANLVIVLKDVKLTELKPLLSYIYLGEVNVTQEKLSALVKAAEFLKIKGLAVPEEMSLENEGEDNEESKRGRGERRKRASEPDKRVNKQRRDNQASVEAAHESDNIVVKAEPEDFLNIKEEFQSPSVFTGGSSFSSSNDGNNDSSNLSMMSSCKYKSNSSLLAQEFSPTKNCNMTTDSNDFGSSNMPLITQLLQETPSIDQLFFSDITKENNEASGDLCTTWQNSVNETTTDYDSCHFMSPSSDTSRRQQMSKGFVCPYDNCHVSYKEKRALQDHMNMHTGMKPYFCSYCNFSATHRTTLIQHKKHKHSEVARVY